MSGSAAIADVFARARADASRSAVLDEIAHRRLMFDRSLRQMVRAGHRYAMVPQDLAPPDGALSCLVDGRRLCGAVAADGGVYWLCLLPSDHDADLGDWRLHGWPFTPARRARELAALLEQTDPVARIERRALMALEGASAFPHLAGDMPPA